MCQVYNLDIYHIHVGTFAIQQELLLRSNMLIADLLMEIAGSAVVQSELPLSTHETEYR